jgi:3-dehydroquinate synthase
MTAPSLITVKGNGFSAYEVIIGSDLLASERARLKAQIPQGRTVIVTDETIVGHHLKTLSDTLDTIGIDHQSLILPEGEGSKSWQGLQSVTDKFIEAGLDRKDRVIALGGGVIGDLTGLAASLTHRGLGFIQIPTTLLAQVDSSVGGKTAIDHARGKNLIGTFWQPSLVLCDISTIETLPMRERRCGMAEIIKYALLGDSDFVSWLEAHIDSVLLLKDYNLVQTCVKRCIEAKAQIVAKDERESGIRALLNLGHTFGHALEAATQFDEGLKHGEAVGLGMALALRFSHGLGYISNQDETRGLALIKAGGLKADLRDLDYHFEAKSLVSSMQGDKKSENGAINLILLKKLGEAFVQKNVSTERLTQFWLDNGAN